MKFKTSVLLFLVFSCVEGSQPNSNNGLIDGVPVLELQKIILDHVGNGWCKDMSYQDTDIFDVQSLKDGRLIICMQKTPLKIWDLNNNIVNFFTYDNFNAYEYFLKISNEKIFVYLQFYHPYNKSGYNFTSQKAVLNLDGVELSRKNIPTWFVGRVKCLEELCKKPQKLFQDVLIDISQKDIIKIIARNQTEEILKHKGVKGFVALMDGRFATWSKAKIIVWKKDNSKDELSDFNEFLKQKDSCDAPALTIDEICNKAINALRSPA